MQVPFFKSAEEDYSLKEMTKSTRNKAKRVLSSVTGKMFVLQMYMFFCVYIFPQRAWVEKSDKSEKKSSQSFNEIKKFKQLCPSASQACLNQQGEQ